MNVSFQFDKLSKKFPARKGALGLSKFEVAAVKTVSLKIKQGETFGLVGESGCGKSTLAKMLVGLLKPTSGKIEIDGEIFDKSEPKIFGKKIQYVFQDPISSLNPRKTIRQIMEAPLKNLHGMKRSDRDSRIEELFEAVNLRLDYLDRKYLSFLNLNNETAIGLDAISAGLGEDSSLLELIVEPYLMQIGFLVRTSRGRLLTSLGKNYINSNND